VLVPFDNSSGFVTSMAIANSDSSSQTIAVAFRTTTGTLIQTSLPAIPAQGHAAFGLPQQFPLLAGQAGLAEFYSNSGSFALLALRFNPAGGFTTSPAYAVTGPPILISGSIMGLPRFSNIAIQGNFSANDQLGVTANFRVVISADSPVIGGYSVGSLSGALAPSLLPVQITTLSLAWNNVLLSGQTLTFNGLLPISMVVNSSGTSLSVASASLTLTLSPDTAAMTTGSVTGLMSIVSSAATLNGSITGSYTASQ
jgi:hypothetical protein